MTTMWKCLNSRFVEDENFYFFWTLIEFFSIQLQKHVPTFDEVKEMEQAR